MKFGPFALDPVRRTLSHDGAPVRLRPMAMALLCHLVRERERIVSKEELFETLWPGGAGSEANLTVTIAAIRKALGEEPGRHRYLITVPKEGYRFVAEVVGDLDGVPVEMPRHVALLPVEVLGELDPGLAATAERVRESIRDHVRCLTGLEVEIPAPASIAPGDFGAVAEALGTDGVLAGTLEGDADSIQLELKIFDANGEDRWHSRILHGADELHTLPIRAARAVVCGVVPDPALRPGVGIGGRPGQSEAWRAYRQGRFHYASGDGLPGLHRAAVAYQQALDLDPSLAAAHAGLGEALILLRSTGMVDPESASTRIREAAAAAFRHDPLLPESHLIVAQVCMIFEHDWQAAREHLMTALEFGSNNPWVHLRYAIYLAWRRQFEAALDAIRRAQELDPFSMRITAEVAKIHHFAGQSGLAQSILRSATNRRLDFSTGWMLAAWFHLGCGDGDAALEALDRVRGQLEATSIWEVFTGTAHGVAGRTEPARAALDSLVRRRGQGESIPPQFDGMIRLSLGDLEGALDCVRRSAEEHYSDLPLVEADPLWAPLRAWPAYEPFRRQFFRKRLNEA